MTLGLGLSYIMLRARNTLPVAISFVSVVRQGEGSIEYCHFKKYISSYLFLLHVDKDKCRHRNAEFSFYVIDHNVEIKPKFNGKCYHKYNLF